MRERHEIRKLNIIEPAWEDLNAEEAGKAKAFDEFFTLDPDVRKERERLQKLRWEIGTENTTSSSLNIMTLS